MQNEHRLFLQTFMYHGIMKGKEVKDSHKRAVEHFEGTYNESDLVHFVKTVNDNIRPFHLEIKKAMDEVTGSHFYILVNKAETSITRQSSDFSVNQLELFKKLISAVVESVDGLISSTDALNLSGQLEGVKMSKKDAAKLFESLKQKKWINEVDGSYYLGPRSVTELEAYILDEYEAATKCHLCQKLCLHGQNCDQCDVRLHNFCAARCFRGARNAVCPREECRAMWRHAVRNVDGDEPTSTSQTDSQRLSQKTAKRSRRQ